MENPQIGSSIIRDFIKARAASLGFCLCGFTDAQSLEHFREYTNWIESNQYGPCDYLNTPHHKDKRADPKLLAPWVKTIVCLAWQYPISQEEETAASGRIAGYTGTSDYHDFIPAKIKSLVSDLSELSLDSFQSAIYCDSAPLLERELANRAGLGWIGKNSCLIHPKFGSALLLAELFLELELPIDSPFTANYCGRCRNCQTNCPAQCINDNHTIDASRCISALTIESKRNFTSVENQSIGNHIFGCDDCQSACPWNQKILMGEAASSTIKVQEMIDCLSWGEDEYRQRFKGTAYWRSKRTGWVRNICAVLANLQIETSIPALERVLLIDPEPRCKIAAAQALAVLQDPNLDQVIAQSLQGKSPREKQTFLLEMSK